MKPLFDSEEFAFIASAENRLTVWCRSCKQEATVQIWKQPVSLRAVCRRCERVQIYAISNAEFVESATPQ